MNSAKRIRIEARISRLIEGQWIEDYIGFDSMDELRDTLENGIMRRRIILHEFTETVLP